MWEEGARRAGGRGLTDDPTRRLAASLYRRYREDRRERRPTDVAALGRDFRRAIVEDFARREVETSFSGAYDFSVVEAVRGPAAKQGGDWRGGPQRPLWTVYPPIS